MRHNCIHGKEATSILNLNIRYFKLEIYLNKENGNGVGIKKQILDNDKRKVTIARLVGVWGKAIVITYL